MIVDRSYRRKFRTESRFSFRDMLFQSTCYFNPNAHGGNDLDKWLHTLSPVHNDCHHRDIANHSSTVWVWELVPIRKFLDNCSLYNQTRRAYMYWLVESTL